MKISEIMEKYNSGELTLEQANEELKAIGADITLKPLTDDEREAKKQREDAEGMIDIGRKPERLPDRPDMSRNMEHAGREEPVIQRTKAGKYAVYYDQDGYAVRAVRL